MRRHKTQLAEVCATLNEHGVRYVVFGASAMQLRGTSRATRDLDILIEPSLTTAKRPLKALSGLGLGLAEEWVAEEIVRKSVTVIGDYPASTCSPSRGASTTERLVRRRLTSNSKA